VHRFFFENFGLGGEVLMLLDISFWREIGSKAQALMFLASACWMGWETAGDD